MRQSLAQVLAETLDAAGLRDLARALDEGDAAHLRLRLRILLDVASENADRPRDVAEMCQRGQKDVAHDVRDEVRGGVLTFGRPLEPAPDPVRELGQRYLDEERLELGVVDDVAIVVRDLMLVEDLLVQGGELVRKKVGA